MTGCLEQAIGWHAMRSHLTALLVSWAALILLAGCGIQIIGPEDGSVVSRDEPVVFEARGLLGAGPLRDVQWHSSIDGDLGRGDALKFPGPGDDLGTDVGPLSDGEHTITARQDGPFGITWEDSILVSVATGGRPPPLTWIRSYVRAGHDTGSSIVNTMDGGYLVAGASQSFSTVKRLWLLKLDRNGDVLWQRTYGPMSSANPNAELKRTADGGFFVSNQGPNEKVHVLRLTSTCAVDWKKTYEPDNLPDSSFRPTSMALTAEGGVYIAGSVTPLHPDFHQSNAWMMRLGAVGDVIWSKRFGTAGLEAFNGLHATSDGGAVAAGSGLGGGPWVVKIDAGGAIEWQYGYPPLASHFEALSVIQTRDGGYLVTGRFEQSSGVSHAWLLRLDPVGTILWHRRYSGFLFETATAARQMSDSEFVVAGAVSNAGQETDLWLFGVGADGDFLWQRRYGDFGAEYAEDVLLAADGGLAAVGHSGAFGAGDSDFWVAKVAGDGSVAGYCPWNVATGAQVLNLSVSASPTDVIPVDLAPAVSSHFAMAFESQATSAEQCPAPDGIGLAAYNLEVNGNIGLPLDAPGSLGQTFTSSLAGQLMGIEISALRCEATAFSELSLELTEGGTSLGSVSIGVGDVLDAGCGVHPPPLQPYTVTQAYFDLTSLNQVLSEGTTYMFTLTATGDFRIGASYADTYEGGTGFYNEMPEPDQDLSFQVLVQP